MPRCRIHTDTMMEGMRQTEGGIQFSTSDALGLAQAHDAFQALLEAQGLARHVETAAMAGAGRHVIRFHLNEETASAWAPDGDTLRLTEMLGLDSQTHAGDLEKEILVAMLLAPVAFAFPSYDELIAALRMRRYIVEAACKTELDFHTTEAERPADCWAYVEDRGFTVLPGTPLVTALRKATQPAVSGARYSFSCYRATEYVILLGIAQELAASNPGLLARLQRQWECEPIMSARFHDVFLREYGAMEAPLPMKYYVPGDRLWFRNPDEASADVVGYEGSWVFYLGGGLFTNFWKWGEPFTLAAKCVEIYHWRHGTYRDSTGELRMDESRVEAHVRASQADPVALGRIVERMQRYRDPRGVYRDGGCIDTTREHPRWVCPGTADIRLP